MKFEITEKFIVLKVEEKSVVNLYTLIDMDGNKLVAIGVKKDGLENRDLVEAKISIKTQREKLDIVGKGTRYIETFNMFIAEIHEVK